MCKKNFYYFSTDPLVRFVTSYSTIAPEPIEPIKRTFCDEPERVFMLPPILIPLIVAFEPQARPKIVGVGEPYV